MVKGNRRHFQMLKLARNVSHSEYLILFRCSPKRCDVKVPMVNKPSLKSCQDINQFLRISNCLSYCQYRAIRHMSKFVDKVFLQNDVPSNEEAEELFKDKEYQSFIRNICHIPDLGHRLLVIQPDVKWGPHKNKLTPSLLRLEETCTLVETLPNWKVVEKKLVSVKFPKSDQIFQKEKFQQLKSEVRQNRRISGVLVGVDLLSSVQLAALQKAWRVPVFDRYAIVLQIFKDHARTKESKLQIALAEIPFLRNRLCQVHQGYIDKQIKDSRYIGGSASVPISRRKLMLKERESKIKLALAKIENHRHLLRNNRLKKEFMSVAVVGYTNSGKTTLIKALTGDNKLEPKDMLFATLDVTVHAGILPNYMKTLYVDTVGFISDIPTNLIQAFSATLEDALIADVIIHVRDISHPDTAGQNQNVLDTLSSILPPDKLHNIIEVCNKTDLVQLEKLQEEENDNLFVSAVTGQGLQVLQLQLQQKLMTVTGKLHKTFRIPNGGAELSWLYKEATVQDIVADKDCNYLIVETIISPSVYRKFTSYFQMS